jgi:hypothetical protein
LHEKKKDPLIYIDGGSSDYSLPAALDPNIQTIGGVDYFVFTLTVQPRRTDITQPTVSVQWTLVLHFSYSLKTLFFFFIYSL